MDLADLIRDESEAAIRHECGPTGRIKKPALIPFFLNHENLKVLRKNLKSEIFAAELRFGPKMDTARAKKLVQAGVGIFMHAALEKAIMEHQSPAERKRREDAAGAEARAAEWYEEEQRVLKSTTTGGSLYTPGAKEKAGTPEA